jgi:hypothetical protein
MDNLKSSFDDVADWMERYLECLRGRKAGMTFGAMLRVCGQLATLPPRSQGKAMTAQERKLTVKIKKLLACLTDHLQQTDFQNGSSIKPVNPASMRANMIYDPGIQKGK